MPPLIDDFVQQYEQRRSHYILRATRAKQICREILANHGIPAIVSSRAKCSIRLRQKLEERDAELHYSTEADIYANIFDFSGVRITVYLPSHVQKVSRLLQHALIPRLIKVYSPTPTPATQQIPIPGSIKRRVADVSKEPFALPGVPVQHITRPTGYCATHLHVLLKPDAHGGGRDFTGADAQVEIQLISLLMHAWSEIEHDLAYKAVGGKPSEEEAAVLKEINECATAGEALLRRLEESVAARERRMGRRCGRL